MIGDACILPFNQTSIMFVRTRTGCKLLPLRVCTRALMTDAQCTALTVSSQQVSDGSWWLQMTVVGPDKIFGVLNFWCDT